MAKNPKTKKVARVPALKSDWYTSPRMVGHHNAIEQYKDAYRQLKPLAKSKSQKDLLNASVDFENSDWHYWAVRLTKKDVALTKHALKAIAKGESWNSILSWCSHRHGMIMDDFMRFLEVKSYEEDSVLFLKKATAYNVWLGMTQVEANKRINNRILTYKKDLGIS